MSKVKSKLSCRLLAAALSMLLVFSMLPMSLFTALAATVEHPDFVTISVVDENGSAVEGAEVQYVIDSIQSGENYITSSGTPTTDANGCIEIMESSAFVADDLTVSAKVSKNGYKTSEISDFAIETAEQDIEISIESMGVVVTSGENLVYDGNAKTLVSITGTKAGDTVSYKVAYKIDEEQPFNEEQEVSVTVESDGQNVKIEKINAAIYKVAVTVKRTDFTDLTENFDNIQIDKADIEDIDISPVKVPFSENGDQNIVELTGTFKKDDVVSWYVKENDSIEWGEPTGSKSIPQKTAVGNYSVRLVVNRGTNYNVFDKNVDSEIEQATIELGSLKIEANKLTYNGNEQKALNVTDQITSGKGKYDLQYSWDGATGWTTFTNDVNYPKVKDYKEDGYTIYVKATKSSSYKDLLLPTPISVNVSKASQTLKFTSAPSSVSGKQNEFPKELQFVATDTSTLKSGASVKYYVEFPEGTDHSLQIDDYATIDEDTGLLQIKSPQNEVNKLVVKAKLAESNNFAEGVVSQEVSITVFPDNQGDFVKIESSSSDYIIGTALPSFTAENLRGAWGLRHFYIENDKGELKNESYGISVGEVYDPLLINNVPKISVSNLKKLAESVYNAGGSLTIKIWVVKDEWYPWSGDKNYCSITVKFDETFSENPTSAYTVSASDGNNGWHKGANGATITPAEGYSITRDLANDFKPTESFYGNKDQGTGKRIVYLKNSTTGAISRIEVNNVKIDSEAATDLKVEYSKSIGETIFKIITLGFYNPSVKVKLTATDVTSGVDKFVWSYARSKDASTSNRESISEREITNISKNGNEYSAIIEISAEEFGQLRGKISFDVYDKAGNIAKMTDNGVFVVDTKSPELTVEYSQWNGKDDNNTRYYGEKQDNKFVVTFKLTEANFDKTKATVKCNDVVQSVEWKPDEGDTYKATLEVKGPGDYVINFTYYEDAGSGNPLVYTGTAVVGSMDQNNKWTSDKLVIDNVDPTRTVTLSPAQQVINGNDKKTISDYRYDGEVNTTEVYYNCQDNVNPTVTFAVIEKYFDPSSVKIFDNGVEIEKSRLTSWGNGVEQYEHIAVYTVIGEGDHVITAEYTDYAGNVMAAYTSPKIVIDKTKPTVKVSYSNKNVINNIDGIDYLDEKTTATITITEHNFRADDVVATVTAKDVTGEDVSIQNYKEYLQTRGNWENEGDVYTATITFDTEANYTFDIDYSDLATNAIVDYSKDQFTFDKTAPEIVKVEYSTSVLETILESVSFGFYNAKMTVTITAEDNIAGVHNFDYSYLTAANVSSVNAQLLNQAIEEANITYSSDHKTATMSFEIPKMVLGNDNQFNGTVEFTATDRSGKTTEVQKETKRIVVDNIAPTAKVEYNKPVNEENGISYYDGNINGTITINEANFYADDVVVMVSKDGAAAQKLPTTWSNTSVDVHVGTFTLTEDADYIVTITYKDKSENKMVDYKSDQLTLDTKIDAPTYTINGTAKSGDNGGAYKDDIRVAFNFADQNFDNQTVKLERIRFDEVKNVTSEFVKVNANDKGGSGSFDFSKVAENDGIYTLTIGIKDKAGHSVESHVKFTVNRFGSVYEFSNNLMDLIKDGGAYVTAVKDDLSIIEYNADRLLAGSLKIEITRDGKPVSDIKFDVSPEINDQVSVGDSGWFQYKYVLKKENFAKDGVYKISISSKDATGNNPENTNYEDKNILFRVDTTAPEITSIVNLEKAIINAQEVTVKYTVFDSIGLKSIKVYVDGKLSGKEITDFSKDYNNYEGEFTLNESSSAQKVRIVVEDIAGNVTDTDSKDFNCEYEFNKTVTVSTNFFVRWYANTWLFWGSIAGVVVLAGILWFIIAKKRKDNDK